MSTLIIPIQLLLINLLSNEAVVHVVANDSVRFINATATVAVAADPRYMFTFPFDPSPYVKTAEASVRLFGAIVILIKLFARVGLIRL
ncbi:hypothetical protein V1514DRAFT_323273 [Lipomyces japonicus]|uniref:uncharacterized protein n=1 Tax=Lipomyces japonicus TaxID=56871 RepID=UPI0034CEE296